MKSYKSAELRNGNVQILIKPFPEEKLTPTSLAIRLDCAGICRADVKEVTGFRDIPGDRGPLFGHEFVGKVIHAGEKTNFQNGLQVTFNPNIIPNRTTGFAEYFFIDGSKNDLNSAIIPIPNSLKIDPLWVPEPFACIVHSIGKFLEHTNSNTLEGKNVGIIGAGNSGLLFAFLAKYYGALIHVFNRRPERIDFAKKRDLLKEEELSLLEKSGDFQGSLDTVIVVPTVIDQQVLQDAFDLVVNGGTIFIYGGTRKENKFLDTQVDIDLIRRSESLENVNYKGKSISICGAYGCYKEDFEECFKLYTDHPAIFPIEKMTSKIITLDDFPEVITKMSSGIVDFPGKVLIKLKN